MDLVAAAMLVLGAGWAAVVLQRDAIRAVERAQTEGRDTEPLIRVIGAVSIRRVAKWPDALSRRPSEGTDPQQEEGAE